MTMMMFDCFGENFTQQVGFRPKYGNGAQSQLLTNPAVTKHGELISRERCNLPVQETRTTIGSRTAFSDMTRAMNAMPQPSLAPTSNPRPDFGAGQCQPRLAKNLQVSMPIQPFVSDELNTPVIDPQAGEQYYDSMVVSSTMYDDMDHLGSGISFSSSQPLESQDLLDTLMASQEDPMMPMAVSSSQESTNLGYRANLKLDLLPMGNVFGDQGTPTFNTPDLMNTISAPNFHKFNLVTFIVDDDVKFDPLDQEEEPLEPVVYTGIKEETPSPCPNDLVIDYVPSPDSTSPSSVHGTAAPPKRINEEFTSDSESSYIQGANTAAGTSRAGPSAAKRARMEAEEFDGSSIPSSANELKVFESRQRNNAASRRSRMNKKSQDEVNEFELSNLFDKHSRLRTRCERLEFIRNELRAMALAHMRAK